MVTGHDAVGIGLPTLLTAGMAWWAVATDLATAAVETRRLFSMLAGCGRGCGAPRTGLHECAAGGLAWGAQVLPQIVVRGSVKLRDADCRRQGHSFIDSKLASPPTSPAGLAQSVERETLNLKAAGSTPAFGYFYL